MPSGANYTISKYIEGGVSIDESNIRDIFEIVSAISQTEAHIKFELDEYLTISSSNIDDILSDSSIRAMKIKKVDIYSRNHVRGISIDFTAKKEFLSSITYSCRGAKAECLNVQRELENILSPMTHWYKFLYKYEPYLWIFSMVVIGVPLAAYNTRGIDNQVFATIILIFSLLGSIPIVGWIRSAICPRIIFNIGKSGIRNSIRKTVVCVFLSGIFMATLVGLFTNYISNKLF